MSARQHASASHIEAAIGPKGAEHPRESMQTPRSALSAGPWSQHPRKAATQGLVLVETSQTRARWRERRRRWTLALPAETLSACPWRGVASRSTGRESTRLPYSALFCLALHRQCLSQDTQDSAENTVSQADGAKAARLSSCSTKQAWPSWPSVIS